VDIVLALAIGSQEKGLGKAAGRLLGVGEDTENHDDDAVIDGNLGINLGNLNLGLGEAEVEDFGVDGLMVESWEDKYRLFLFSLSFFFFFFFWKDKNEKEKRTV